MSASEERSEASSEHFPNLKYPVLKEFISRIVGNEAYPFNYLVERILLYRGLDEFRYVLVVEFNKPPADDLKREEYLKAASPWEAGAMRFLDDGMLREAHRDSTMMDYDDWAIFPCNTGDDLPETMILKEYSWLLYERKRAAFALPKKPTCRELASGCDWGDIKITLKSNETVKIRGSLGEYSFTYAELELSDMRTVDKPTKLWDYLVAFCHHQGFLSPNLVSGRNRELVRQNLTTYASRLNKYLQNLFGITESVFAGSYKKNKGYKMKILFSDETQVVPKEKNRDIEEVFLEDSQRWAPQPQ
jgi:hypothetical protein